MVRIISFLQAFTMILVVVGHSFIGIAAEEPFVYGQKWIYSFHIPLFFAISGWLFSYKYKDNISGIQLYGANGFIMGKVRRLLVPYFLLSSLTFPVKAYLSRYAVRPISFSFGDYLHQLIYPYDNVMGQLWFLPTLFFVFLIALMIHKLLRSVSQTVLQWLMLGLFLASSLLFKPWEIELLNISGILYYLFYFQLGVMVQKYGVLERIQGTLTVIPMVISLVSTILLLLLPYFVGHSQLAALAGMTFSVSIGYMYIHCDGHFLDHLFGASYTIFLFSWFPQVFSHQIILQYFQIDSFIPFVVSCLLGLYVPLLIYQYEIKENKTLFRTFLRIVNGMKTD